MNKTTKNENRKKKKTSKKNAHKLVNTKYLLKKNENRKKKKN
jgi:hypothetical protein